MILMIYPNKCLQNYQKELQCVLEQFVDRDKNVMGLLQNRTADTAMPHMEIIS